MIIPYVKYDERMRSNIRLLSFFLFGVSTSWIIFAVGTFAVPYVQFSLSMLDRTPFPLALDTETVTYALPHAEPIRLRIPEIGLDVPFEDPLGIDERGVVEVPKKYTTVGWYRYGPTPGEKGPAVVLGHVDSYKGPAVFHKLPQLNVGDLIEVEREDGTRATFIVEHTARYEQDDFPNEIVYGDISYAGLRLVTCMGTFDRKVQRYSHNLVVFARLIEPERSADANE